MPMVRKGQNTSSGSPGEGISVKMLLYVIVGSMLIVGILFVALSLSSRKQPELGLLNGQLRPCPVTPNCVCSEWPSEGFFVEPLSYSIAHADAWQSLQQGIVALGGEVVSEQRGYLHVRFVTPIMRYVDDVELRLDADKHIIHIRSASRVGHSDLGANRQRVARIRTAFYGENGAEGSLH